MNKRDVIRALRAAGCEGVVSVNGEYTPAVAFRVDGVPVALCVGDCVEVVSVNGRRACGAWRFHGSAETVARAVVEAVRCRQGYHLYEIEGVSYAPCENAFDELLEALPGEGVLTHDRASGFKMLQVDGYMITCDDNDKAVVWVGGIKLTAGAAVAWIKG